MNAFLLVSLAFVGFCSAQDTSSLTATTILEKPYVSVKSGNSSKPTSGRLEYEGYIPDLLEKISKIIKRNFTLQIVQDGKYGAKTGNTWNGMIGELMSQKADVVAAALTVSAERSNVVEFTDHFMTFDTIVLLKRDTNAMKIRSAYELRNQTEVKYGVVRDGFTENFFKTSSQEIYRQMYDSMDRSQFPTTAAAGVAKVRDSNGKYAFIIESSTADFWLNQKPCDLVSFRLGSALPYHDYSFAVKKGRHDLKNQLNDAFTQLKSKGEHDVLKAKWWPTECSTAASQRSTYTGVGALISALLVVLSASRV